MYRTSTILFCCLAFSCSEKQAPAELPEDPKPAIAVEAKEEPPQPEKVVRKAPEVSLLAPGKSPRRVLRWQFEEGQTQAVSMGMDLIVDVTADGQARPRNETPTVLIDMTMAVDDVTPEGVASVSMEVTKAGLGETDGFPPRIVGQMQTAAEGINGLKGSYRCDPRGFVEDLEFDIPSDAPLAARQQAESIAKLLRRVVTPLPEEAIGIGGKWTVARELDFGGMQGTDTAGFEIKRLKLPTVAVAIADELKASPQTIVGAGGNVAKLQSFDAASEGAARWSLNELMPASWRSAMKVTMSVLADGPDGLEHETKVGMEMKTKITSQ